MKELTPEIIKMWSDELKKDAWWIVDGDNYIGPFKKWCDAKIFKGEDKKPFDITNHEFSDVDIRVSNLCKSKIEFAVDDCGIEHYFTQSKADVIAIAKALGVTGEDLK